ncbi:uncharacterized protein LOC128666884 [Bombina bombina]|uniref:uncharacterized protein LOC128666884 n=1 Tax=Bombina bombina TaxID=8345 RepID=UPI00235B179C|nr:uncharacterized protein LOC128666884 [Bombina bombina]
MTSGGVVIGQTIRSTSSASHTFLSADTLPDIRTSTPETSVGRGTADLGHLFRNMTGSSPRLFDDPEESSREVILNLVAVQPERPEEEELQSRDHGSETPDLLDDIMDAQPMEIHEPVPDEAEVQEQTIQGNVEPAETQSNERPVVPGNNEIEEVDDVCLNEMISLARQYRVDHRELQNVLIAHLDRSASLAERQLQLDRERFDWQRRMDEEHNEQINRSLRLAEQTMNSLLSIIRERQGPSEPNRPGQ